MAINIPLITTFDAKGINRAVREFKKLEGGVNKSAFVLKNLDRASTNAFKSIAKVSAGLAIGAGIVGKALVSQAMEAKRVTAETNAIIKATGGAARISAKGVADLSDKLSMQIGVDDELIQKTANLLLTFKQVQNVTGEGNDIFTQAVTLAQDLGSVFGSADAAAMQLGKALSDPIAGITALRRAGINFTAQQKEQIKTLVDSGKTLEAQKLILAEVESQVGGTAKATSTDFGRMQVAIENVAEKLGALLLPYLEDFANFITTTIVPILDEFASIVGEEGLGAGIKFLGGELLNFFGNLEGTGAIIYGIVAAFVALKIAMTIATTATVLFGAAFASTGIGLIIIAISAVIVAVGAMAVKFQWFRDTLKDIWNNIVMFVQDYINAFLGVYEFFINKFIQGANILIEGYNKFNNVFGGTDITPLKEVNYEINLMGALMEQTTKKAIIMANTINKHVQGTGVGGSRRSPEMGGSGLSVSPLPDFDSGGGTVKTMAERFQELIASVQGYGKQLKTVNEAQKTFEEAPLDLKVAIEATAKAQDHFNKTLNGFGIESKEAIRATRNLEEALRNSTRAGIGLADAQQAVNEAQKELTRLQSPASARSIQEAQDAITQARFDLADADKELAKAEQRNNPRELELARIAQRDATNALADATLGLTELQSGASAQEITDATEVLTEAELSLAEAQLGVEEATEGVTTAQTLLDEAVNGAKVGTDAYTEALKLLTEAKEKEATATDLVTTSTIALKDAKLALADAEAKVRIGRGGMTADEVSNAERLTGIAIGNIPEFDFSKVDFEALGRMMKGNGIPIAGQRASGGSVQGNKSYIVGERGVELFTPSTGGMVTPNSALGGSQTNITVNAGLISTPDQIGQQIIEAIQKSQRRSGKVFVTV